METHARVVCAQLLPPGHPRLERTLQLLPRLGITVAFDANHDEKSSLSVMISPLAGRPWKSTGTRAHSPSFRPPRLSDLPSDSGMAVTIGMKQRGSHGT